MFVCRSLALLSTIAPACKYVAFPFPPTYLHPIRKYRWISIEAMY